MPIVCTCLSTRYAAAAALHALDNGDMAAYEEIFAPTAPLSRKIFESPTYHYKTGIVFLAWLAGHQDAFTMVNGAQSARSIVHLADVINGADLVAPKFPGGERPPTLAEIVASAPPTSSGAR